MTKSVHATIERLAMGLPNVTRAIACEGTKLEATTFDVGAKSFVFLRRVDAGYEVRLKLTASRDEALALAAADPTTCSIGASGWAKLVFDDASAPLERLRRWIPESHAALAPKATGRGKRSRG